MMDRVLVTGGAGYIGSHAVLHLKRMGCAVDVIDNLSTGHREALHCDNFFEGCLTDRDFLASVFAGKQYTSVLHFAAKSIVAESEANPLSYFRNNVCGTLNILEAMTFAKCTKLVFSSTAAVYGEPNVIPITEQLPIQPVNAYGISKAVCEQLIQKTCSSGLISCVAFRYFNAAGADHDGMIGESHNPETHLIPIVLEVAMGSRSCLRVFGDDFPTPDGTCVRDYIHVSDLADAHVLAISWLHENPGFHVFNLGASLGLSVKQIIGEARRVSGKDIRFEIAPRRSGDPSSLVADASKANQSLGWQAHRSTIENILTTAMKWHASRRF